VIDRAALTPALDEVRSLVRADGGDLVLVSVDDDAATVRLALELTDAHCIECVMPRDFLEQIALDVVRRQVPDVVAVGIDDPRESPDWVAPEH
jgi:Fe-S cluster biogenesis protein NfuA